MISVSTVDVMIPIISNIANPRKMGSNKIAIVPNTTPPAVSTIGVVRTVPASITAYFNGTPSFKRMSMGNTEFRTMIPAKAINPTIDGTLKYAPIIQ